MLELGSDDRLEGSTIGATFDDVMTCVSDHVSSPRGVWYKAIGTGDLATISLCDGTYFDSAVSIFQGSCNDLSFIGSSDDFGGCSPQSEFIWSTEAGTVYYILVRSVFLVSPNTVPCLSLPRVSTVSLLRCRYTATTRVQGISLSRSQDPFCPQTMTTATELPEKSNSIVVSR